MSKVKPPKVSKVRRGPRVEAKPTLRDVPRPERQAPARATVAPVPTARTGPRRASQLEACRRIVDPWVAKGFGWRAGLYGASGSGKTFFSKRLLEYALAHGSEVALVYDHKDPTPGFDGCVYPDVAAFARKPPTADDNPVIVFHTDGPGEPDEVAHLGLYLGLPCVVCIDELFPDSVSEGGQHWRNGATCPQALLLRRGRSVGASAILGTQMPQEIPTAVGDLCENNVFFRLQARGLDYVDRERRAPREAIPIIRDLQTGECIVISEGAWDGCIYGPE